VKSQAYVTVCCGCGGEVVESRTEVSVCTECGDVEGDTKEMTREEFERDQE
jgi:rRNA maturation endonuclease Nob1